jgi:hypothetical protein
VTFQMIVYGVVVDVVDGYACVGESTALLCRRRFTIVVVKVYETT